MKVNKLVWIIAVLFVITSCGTLKTFRASQSVKKKGVTAEELAEYGEELAGKFGLMALFAESVYRRSSDLESKDIITECGDENSPDADYLMPWAEVDGTRYSWGRLFNSEVMDAEPCYSDGGLYYETYVLRDLSGAIMEAVIAYRGTDGFKDDMVTNLSAAFGIEPHQYADARSRLKNLVTYLLKVNSEIKIYAVGHSLGGGLAQQAGYLSKDINEVFVFNTSPITNWSSVALKGDIENHYPTIYRINHGGEILGPIRFITTSFTSSRYNRFDITFQVTEKNLIKGHAMKIIACRFAEGVANAKSVESYAEHFYGKEYIKNQLLGIEGGSKGSTLCSATDA